MAEIQIKDLYAGKPDAKDEINFEGLDDFVKTFVVADNFNLDSLINGSNCFITGFKGTGKTALLFYLDSVLKQKDESSCTSFVFFKEEFTDAKRDELEVMSRRILSSISIDRETLVGGKEFEYIWRWLLFKRIVADNEEYNDHLFVQDANWDKFQKTIGLIKAPSNKKKTIIPRKFKMALPYTDPKTMAVLSPEIEVDLQNSADENYKRFTAIIDEAERLFVNLNRTDIPYYVFVDELEAYYGEINIFMRDLCLIRDLVFTVKRFNSAFRTAKMQKTKMICSVRTEILNAISRYVVTKEINKVTSGFSVPLTWSYGNTSSYAHPIIQILLKRIAICENAQKVDFKKLYEKWFPEKIHGIEPANYILNNSWCKPRDMVRLLTVSINCIQNRSTAFKQAVFNSLNRDYAEDSLVEIKEELRALYNPEEIDTIISCFMGYKTSFSTKQLRDRVSLYFAHSVLDEKFTQVIADLYRLGFLGNFLPVSKAFRWQHKGDDRVILSDEWRLVVHYALHGALSLGSQQDFGLNRGELPQIGDVAIATVHKVIPSFVLVEFKHYGAAYAGSIHISQFKKLGYGYIKNLWNIAPIGTEYQVSLRAYLEKHECWQLELLPQENAQG